MTVTGTVTLTSHHGHRARVGFGPRNFPLMDLTPLIDFTTVDSYGDEIRTRIAEDGDSLYIGYPANRVLGDMERDPDGNITFDGDLPWQDGCGERQLYFDANAEYVYRYERSILPLIVVSVEGGAYGYARQVARVVTFTSPDWLGLLDKVTTHNGRRWDAPTERTRTALTVFESLPDTTNLDAATANVTIHDEARARAHFDVLTLLRSDEARYEQAARQSAENLRNLANKVDQIVDGYVPAGYSPPTHSTSSYTNLPVDRSADRLIALRDMITVFAAPYGTPVALRPTTTTDEDNA